MKRTLLLTLGGALAATSLAAAMLWGQPTPAGAAAAAPAALTAAQPAGPGRVGPRQGGAADAAQILAQLLRAIEAATGLDAATIRAGLQDGQSLAQIAAANGSSGEAIVQAAVDAADARLDQALANGRITQAQADRLLAKLRERATEVVNDETLGARIAGRVERGRERAALAPLVRVAAEQTGLEPRAIAGRLAAGETLREIVTDAGGDPQAVIDAAVEQFRQLAADAMR